jgi:hypothetical protein
VTDIPLVSAELLALAGKGGPPPKLYTGSAEGVTSEDGATSVRVKTAADVFDEETDSEDLNPPVEAITLIRPVSAGEEVLVLQDVASGAAYVVPYASGLIGVASIPGGEPDVAVVSTSPVSITDLEAEAEILWPDHLIEIQVNAYISSGGAANTLIGRVMREDEDGVSVEVGRFLRSNQVGNNQTIQVGVPVHDVAPEPGVYSYRPSIEAAVTGWSIILSPGSTPETAASLTVYDKGALPTTAARV